MNYTSQLIFCNLHSFPEVKQENKQLAFSLFAKETECGQFVNAKLGQNRISALWRYTTAFLSFEMLPLCIHTHTGLHVSAPNFQTSASDRCD